MLPLKKQYLAAIPLHLEHKNILKTLKPNMGVASDSPANLAHMAWLDQSFIRINVAIGLRKDGADVGGMLTLGAMCQKLAYRHIKKIHKNLTEYSLPRGLHRPSL